MITVDLGLYSIVMKYAYLPRGKGSTIYYRRRVPSEHASYYSGKVYITRSTGTSDPKKAASALVRINQEIESDWNRLASGLPLHVDPTTQENSARLLAKYDINPHGKGHAEDIADFKSDVFEELPDLLKSDILFNGLAGDGLHYQVESALPLDMKLAYQRVSGRLSLSASDYCKEYLDIHQRGQDKKFRQGVEKSFDNLIDLVGDKSPSEYLKIDVRQFIRSMQALGLSTSTIKRRLSNIRSAFNKISDYHDLNDDKNHPFKNWDIPNYGYDVNERADFTAEQLHALRNNLNEDITEVGCLIKLALDTGLRVAECVGLRKEDVRLSASTPYVEVRENPFRRLKTKNSSRFIPLVGDALGALKYQIDAVDSEFVFPKYVDMNAEQVKNDTASNAANKRLRSILGADSPTMHSFRHTMQTRLRDVLCPEDIREEMLGWASKVSQYYGSPTDLGYKAQFMEQTLCWEAKGVGM